MFFLILILIFFSNDKNKNKVTDIIGAKKIGFKTAWIKMDFEYPKDLSPPDYIIESFNEIEV